MAEQTDGQKLIPEPVDLAYAAGVLDGEGCIGLHWRRGNKLQLQVWVKMTDATVPNWLSKVFGGRVYLQEAQNLHWKGTWGWNACANKALDFLLLVRPYLKLKCAQADVAIDFQKRRLGRPRAWGSPDAGLDGLDKLFITELNKKGVS